MVDKKISVLIPDGENYLLSAVVHGLAQVPGVDVYVMSNARHKSMRFSRYVRKFTFYPKTDSELEWIAYINLEIDKHDIDVVIPVWEIGVKTLVKNKEKIIQKDKLCLLPNLEALTIAINKALLAKHLEIHQLPNPKTIPLDSIEQLEQVVGLKFPVLLKPKEGFGGGHGIRIFNSKKGIEHYLIENKIDYECLLQEYIEGYDIDCSVLCKNGDILAFTIQKGNMMGSRAFSPPIGLDFLYDKELYNVVSRLMKSLNWSGVAHIDMRYDKNDKQFKIIEINSRYWGSLDASILAGVNFPHLHCLASLNRLFSMPGYRFIRYLSMEGILKTIRRNVFSLFRFRFMLNNTSLKFALKDPLPMLHKLFYRSDHLLS
jgi:predicted ATP-grasp superfamily ATP-dependent carboligase